MFAVWSVRGFRRRAGRHPALTPEDTRNACNTTDHPKSPPLADETEPAPPEDPDRSEVRRCRVRDETRDLRLRERPRDERLNDFGREPERPILRHDGEADFGDADRFGVLGEPVAEEFHRGTVVLARWPAGGHFGPEKACERPGRPEVRLDQGQGRRDEVEAARGDGVHGGGHVAATTWHLVGRIVRAAPSLLIPGT